VQKPPLGELQTSENPNLLGLVLSRRLWCLAKPHLSFWGVKS